MPGQTNNDLAIDALNQAIVALNELAAQFNTGGGDPNSLAANLELVAENIDATRVALETGQTAAITAQNTNFNDLIVALEAGCLTKYITIQRGACGYGAIVGTEIPSDSGDQDGSPPGYFQETDEAFGSEAYYSRKCKAANALHDQLRELIGILRDQQVDNMSAVSFVVISTLLGAAIGELSTPVPFIDATVGGVVGLLGSAAIDLFVLLGQVDFQELTDSMDLHRDDLVCALYLSDSGTGAINDYVQKLSDNGVSVGNQNAVRAVFWLDVANNLFFKSQESIEAALATYTPSYDCGNCVDASCPDFILRRGSIVSQNGNQYTILSEFRASSPDGYWISFHFGQHPDGGTCGPPRDIRVISVDQPTGTYASWRLDYDQFLGGSGPGNTGWDEIDDDWTQFIGQQRNEVRTLTMFKDDPNIQYQIVIEIV